MCTYSPSAAEALEEAPDVSETLTEYDLTDRYRRTEGRVLLTGIQALARIVEQLRRDRPRG